MRASMPGSQDMLASANRRNNSRPPVPRFGVVARIDDMIVAIIENLKCGWVTRIVLLSMVILSLGCVWWSYSYRLPMVEGSKAYLKKVYTLQRDVEILKMGWHEGRMDQEKLSLSRHEKNTMPNLETMNAWLQQQVHAMQSLGFQVSWHINGQAPVSHDLSDMRIILVPLDIHQKSGYLDFRKALSVLIPVDSHGGRVEMANLRLDGDGKGMEKVTVDLRVWLKQSEDIDRLIHVEASP